MRHGVLGMRVVLWVFFAANVYVTLVVLSGGSAAIINLVASFVLGASLTFNYVKFDRKGNLRERAVRENRSDVVVPDTVGGRLPHHVDLEHFDWKSHRDSGINGGSGSNAVRHAQALGNPDDEKALERTEPGKDKAVD